MRKKRITSLIMAAILSLTTLYGTASATSVSDISGHWAEGVISKWLDAEKINGYEDGTFKPDNLVTRAEFVTILSNVVSDNGMNEEEVQPFKDVEPGEWFYDNVTRMLQAGIVSEADYFYPNDYITREDAMTMIGRAFYVRSFDPVSVESFADYDKISDYAIDYVAGFVENGYVKGYEDNTIRPKDPITRAESLQILDNLGIVHDKNSLEGIMDRIYEGVEAQMPSVMYTRITDETAEYYLGLKSLDNIDEALASETMIGSIAHSVCLVRASEGADIEAMKEQIRTSVNPRKWICVGVERDEVIVVNQGNLILLIIDSSAPQEIADSFMALDLIEEQPALVPDADNLLYTDGYYMDYIGELRPDSVINFANKVETLSDTYFQNSTGVYYAVIPSKSYFVNDRLETPFDYSAMESALQQNITSAKYINLFDTLTLEDYYKTDPHWRQDRLQKVVDRLGENLGFEIDLSQYTANTVEQFIGQHGYGKENFPSEQLVYLTNDAINGAYVDNMENPEFHQVYDTDKLSSDSPYDLFLSGPTPLTTITNESAATDKELVIFRDSFACSLAPLLIENYKTITLVDIRYVYSPMLGNYINFDGKDILFLYNEQIVNYSEMLK